MNKHVLLTISDDSSAMQAVRFLVKFFHNFTHLHVTMLYVTSNPKAGLNNAEILDDFGNLQRREQHVKAHAEAALSKAVDFLCVSGFPEHNIHKKIAFKQLGTAHDIVQEGISGLYDAIALGRRGLSRLEELLAESVSKQVFVTPIETPLWICRNQTRFSPHVLLCTDGSPASLRCADHVGFMLKDEPEHKITIAHVQAQSGADISVEAFAGARRMLEENGIGADRISEHRASGKNISDAIVCLAREGNYGVVATGRTGRGESKLKRVLGSVSMHLLRHLDSASLWISH
ncbi:MAG: universal stress protein [Desulfovibrionales bacterium]|nr:universal stress protein [Desulfovibrionales bacterium]